MAYSTATQVRAITGLSTDNISDADVEAIITIVDTIIDDEVAVSLTASHKTNASIFLTSAYIMLRFSTTSLASDAGGGISLDRLRIDGKSTQNLRSAKAKEYIDEYNKIIVSGTTLEGLIKKIEG